MLLAKGLPGDRSLEDGWKKNTSSTILPSLVVKNLLLPLFLFICSRFVFLLEIWDECCFGMFWEGFRSSQKSGIWYYLIPKSLKLRCRQCRQATPSAQHSSRRKWCFHRRKGPHDVSRSVTMCHVNAGDRGFKWGEGKETTTLQESRGPKICRFPPIRWRSWDSFELFCWNHSKIGNQLNNEIPFNTIISP